MIFSIFPVTTLALATLATLVFGQSHKRLESAPSSELGGFVVNLDIIIHRHHLSYSCERHHYDKKKIIMSSLIIIAIWKGNPRLCWRYPTLPRRMAVSTHAGILPVYTSDICQFLRMHVSYKYFNMYLCRPWFIYTWKWRWAMLNEHLKNDLLW